jgi:hypothetical protein
MKICPRCGRQAPGGNCLPCANSFANTIQARTFYLSLFMTFFITAFFVLASVLYLKANGEKDVLEKKLEQCQGK